MSPILYLFYDADLLETLQEGDSLAARYIDDIAILAVGPIAGEQHPAP